MNGKKILLYCVFAFTISWLTALGLHLAEVPSGTTLSLVLIATLYMPGPALATLIVQKGFFKEDLASYGLLLKWASVKWILLIPLVFLCLLIFTYLTIFIGGLFEHDFGQLVLSSEFISHKLAKRAAAQGAEGIEIPAVAPASLIAITLLSAIVAGYTINLPFMLGEELGWRGLLTGETRSLGFWRSNLLVGTIWGLWHAPIIVMGHNYPNYPYLGILVMTAFTISISFPLAYLRYKTRTIWGPCAFHGMMNATASLFLFTVANGHELLSGLAGLASVVAGLLLSLLIPLFDREFITHYSSIAEGADWPARQEQLTT